jgi:hypothetical protein
MTRTTLTCAVAVAVAATAAPSASARPIDDFPRTEPPQVRIVSESRFDWGDAGAGAAFAAVAMTGTLAVRHRRRRMLEAAS